MSEKDRTSIIEQVRKLWALADDPRTPEHERDTAASMAQKLMAKHAIEEIALRDASRVEEEIVLVHVRITEEGKPALVKDQRIGLCWVVAKNQGLRAVVTHREETADVVTGKRVPGGTFLAVAGYKSDVEFFREFYFGLAMDLTAALLDEEVKSKNYQKEFASAYVTRIDERLKATRREVEQMAEEYEGGSLLPALLSQKQRVDMFFDRMFPPESLKSVRVARSNYDPNARERGRRAADRADIGQGSVEGGSRGALEKERKGLGVGDE
jgi:hypothetical protein